MLTVKSATYAPNFWFMAKKVKKHSLEHHQLVTIAKTYYLLWIRYSLFADNFQRCRTGANPQLAAESVVAAANWRLYE